MLCSRSRRNVSFRYPDAKVDAIKDLSFTIPAGATVIIVCEVALFSS